MDVILYPSEQDLQLSEKLLRCVKFVAYCNVMVDLLLVSNVLTTTCPYGAWQLQFLGGWEGEGVHLVWLFSHMQVSCFELNAL